MKKLSEKQAVAQIVKTVRFAKPGVAPFALVLGSGFSRGLVPTAEELVTETLPLWMKSLTETGDFETQKRLAPEQRRQIARDFWRDFVEVNSSGDLTPELDPHTGLPKNSSQAYMAAFTPGYQAVGEPAMAREFQRAMMRLDSPRLNAAHFLLASLLGVQPGRMRKSDSFTARAAFSRLILTTNFDPFLQIALQAVNRLYFMSDTPNLVRDDIFDEQDDVIHLVYLHGSIHRRSQAATEESIQEIKKANASALEPVLRRHGVIVLGYSGWDDAIVEALSSCPDFAHYLYWCGLEADPATTGAFGPRVADILRKQTAFYVQTPKGAAPFMAEIVKNLVKGVRLLDNPIAQLREMLSSIDLSELKNLQTAETTASSAAPLTDAAKTTASPAAPLTDAGNDDAFVNKQKSTLQLLENAERLFFTPSTSPTTAISEVSPPSAVKKDGAATEASRLKSREQVKQLLASARVASALGNHDETLKISNEALALRPDAPGDLADLLFLRGLARALLARPQEAIPDWTSLADLPDAPVDRVALALRNLGITYTQTGDEEGALTAYTRLIDRLPNAPVEQVAAALRNRALIFNERKETDKALGDYSRLIEGLPDAPVDHVAAALRNRALIFTNKTELEKALADYSHLIDKLPGAPAEHVSAALRNRGLLFTRMGENDKALADYSRVIEQMPDAPIDNVAESLATRGWTKYLRNDVAGFLTDTELALNKVAALDFAAFNLGLALLANRRDAEAVTAYERAGKEFPKSIETVGLADLEEAKKTWLNESRAKPVIELLRSLKM